MPFGGLSRHREGQGQGCPCGPSCRDPLILLEWKTAVEIGLEFHRTAMDIPRAILILRAEQKRRTAAERSIRNRNAASPIEGVEHFARRVRIAGETGPLRPAADLIALSKIMRDKSGEKWFRGRLLSDLQAQSGRTTDVLEEYQ